MPLTSAYFPVPLASAVQSVVVVMVAPPVRLATTIATRRDARLAIRRMPGRRSSGWTSTLGGARRMLPRRQKNRVLRESPDPTESGLSGEAAFSAVTRRPRRGPATVALAAIAFVGFAFLTKEL